MITYLDRLRRIHWRLAPALTIAAALAMLIIGLLAHRYEIVRDTLWVLGFWTAISLACGAIGGALNAHAKTRRQRAVDRELREARERLMAKIETVIAAQSATPHASCICPTTAAGLDLCDRCPGRNP